MENKSMAIAVGIIFVVMVIMMHIVDLVNLSTLGIAMSFTAGAAFGIFIYSLFDN